MDTKIKLYEFLINNLPDAFAYQQIVTDNKGEPVDYTFLDVNPAFVEMVGLSGSKIIGKKATEVLPENELSGFDWISTYGKVALNGEQLSFEQFMEIPDSRYKIIVCSDEPGYFATIFKQIIDNDNDNDNEAKKYHHKYHHQIKETETNIDANEEEFRTLFEQNILAIYLHDFQGNIIDVNDRACMEVGYSREELLGMTIFDLICTKEKGGNLTKRELLNIFSQMDVGERTTVEDVHQRKDGTIFYVEVSTGVVSYKNNKVIMGLAKDITERKLAEEKIKYLSFHDELTGLYNRAFLNEELKRIDTSRQLPLSIIMIDVNGLKLVNDVYGHEAGDKMLIDTAEIIKKSCRSEDIVGRWGGR